MKDQEIVTDLLLTEKKMSGNYNTFASECVNDRLRDAYEGIITASHKTQTDLFKTGQQKGWYQVEQAPAQKIDEAVQKFSQIPTVQG